MRIMLCLRAMFVLGTINAATAFAVVDSNAPVVKLARWLDDWQILPVGYVMNTKRYLIVDALTAQ